MELPFNVDLLLPDKISKFDNKLQVNGSAIDAKEKRTQLLKIIDKMGAASAKAQDLHIAVTTGEKFLHSEHVIYLMKDESGDKSVVVGILKMGRKKLFLINKNGTQNEMYPLCVLDFYVHESKQRMGYGKLLFEFMLKEENILPHLLAIDRPSTKFLAFLRKHYNLSKTIPQVNHFIIFEGFFNNRYATRRKSTDYQSTHEKEKLESNQKPGKNQHKNLKRLSYPYYTGNENESQWLTTQEKIYSRYQNEPSVSQRHSNIPTSTKLHQFDSRESTIHAKLTPDGSCASHLVEDSTMKIFGVPSAWMQASGR